MSNVASFNLPANSGPAGAGGACTNALLANVYGTDQELSWIGLLTKMQATLKTKGYTQIPQFSGSRKINLEGKFNLVNERSNGRQKVGNRKGVVGTVRTNRLSVPACVVCPACSHCSSVSTTSGNKASFEAATTMSLACRRCWTSSASSAAQLTSAF